MPPPNYGASGAGASYKPSYKYGGVGAGIGGPKPDSSSYGAAATYNENRQGSQGSSSSKDAKLSSLPNRHALGGGIRPSGGIGSSSVGAGLGSKPYGGYSGISGGIGGGAGSYKYGGIGGAGSGI